MPSLLQQKKEQRLAEQKEFSRSSRRSIVLGLVVLLLVAAVIAVIGLALMYSLTYKSPRDYKQEGKVLVTEYSLHKGPHQGCASDAQGLFTAGNMTSSTANEPMVVYYLLENGDIKPWQFVGDQPIYLVHHGGETLKIHIVNSDGNYSMMMLGNTATDQGKVVVHLPFNHWHSWELVQKFSYSFISVVTTDGQPDFTQQLVVDIERDLLPMFVNSTHEDMVRAFGKSEQSSYCTSES